MLQARPYLSLGEVEILNGQRTLTYLRRGLGGGSFIAELAGEQVGESGYSDTYGDAYSADPYWPGNLACFCSIVGNGPYISPAADPAPWYDAGRPESGDFLGLIADVSLPSVLRRSVRGRGGGGGVLGAQGMGPRMIRVEGVMYAASERGMGWGERWLNAALAGDTDECPDAEAVLLPFCPPDDAEDPEAYWRRLAEVGLVDPPVFEQISDVAACSAQSVSFQLVAGRPWLLAPATTCIGESLLRDTPTLHCLLEPVDVLARAGARITVRAGVVGSPIGGIVISAAPTTGGACPSASADTISYTVDRLLAGEELVIDPVTRTVTVTQAATGQASSGWEALSFSGLFQWIEAIGDEQLCITIDGTAATLNAGTLVGVEQIPMEL